MTQHMPFLVYQRAVVDHLRSVIGMAIPAEWWSAQTRPDGQHRTWTHYNMGLNFDQSAEEMRPFAEAQIVRPLPKTDHWKDVCSLYENG